MIINLPCWPSNLFMRNGKLFSTRVSQIVKYDPEADEAPHKLGVEQPSGRIGVFKYDSTEIELSHGQVIAWHYLPTNESMRDLPELVGASLVIFNN